MQLEKTADIKENEIAELDAELLSVLLKDRSSGRNILWATDNYVSRGMSYAPSCPITVKQISGKFGKVIRPRIDKSKKEQQIRVKDKAEVFTPSWICNKQNNAADEDWFERKNVFNSENGRTWTTNKDKITFPDGKTWQDYVLSRRLEITCGEAPYLCSRYDTTTGKWIEVGDRIGVLDRKIRIVSENTDSEKDWVAWVIKAYQSTYGYEWQGDSVLIARENLLYTFIDYYVDRFQFYPIKEYLFEIAKIVSWNIWQMDGLKYVIPNSCKPIEPIQLSLFDDENKPHPCPGCESNKANLHTGIYCKIMNWRSKHSTKYVNLKGAKNMKFDYVIGNPPYQQQSGGGKIADDSVYSYFMDAAYSISDRVLLITPAKFLFNNGNTPTKWNEKMLNDEHFKVLFFEPIASKVFNIVSFMGGVAIHYRDKNRIFSPIVHYSEFPEMNTTLRKVLEHKEKSLTTIMYNQNKFELNTLYEDYADLKNMVSSNGKERRLTSGCLIYPCFHVDKESNDDIEILGVIKNKRERRFIKRKYIEEPHPNLEKYKVIVPANNGSGAIGEVPSTSLIGEPLIGEPFIGFTQTFISIGAFDERYEAENALKYVKSKFARTMQAAFRAQNPCLFSENGAQLRKQNAYVFDFDPARTLTIVEEFANDLVIETANGRGDSDTRKQNVRELLNFFPVYGEDDEGEMIALDAEKVLSIPRAIHAKEVVRRGFMSNFLFQNIGNIFNAPKEVLDIIQKFEPVKEPIGVTEKTKSELDIDENGEIKIPEQTIIGTATEIFGEKLYGDIEDRLASAVETVGRDLVKSDKRDETLDILLDSFHVNVTDTLVKKAKDDYGADMSRSTQNALVRKINSNADSLVKKHYGDYRIQAATLESERQKAVDNAATTAERIQINKEFAQRQHEARDTFLSEIRDKVSEVIDTAGKTIVETVETDKKEKQKNGLMDKVRDHLRGFARTIPSFLMAYGDENITLLLIITYLQAEHHPID